MSWGKGPIYGQVLIKATPGAPDQFTTQIHYVYARSGQSVARSGKALVYTGFQWRGRSFQEKDANSSLREVMFVQRDWRRMSGRWFTGAYDEIGMDIALRRVGSDPLVLGVDPMALKTASGSQILQIYGANLPTALAPGDVDFGQGIQVNRVVNANADRATVEVQVASEAPIGARDLFLAGAARQAAVVVYDKVDKVKVVPQAGMARVGGINFPKQYQQFEAQGYNKGPDGKPNTKDDLNLGIVDVTWSIEEYTVTFGDDDKDFVGSIDAAGLFTPNVDGPNPSRKNNTNNFGDVWVVATFRPETGDGPPKPIRARAHLLVTVPLYVKYDQPEVVQ